MIMDRNQVPLTQNLPVYQRYVEGTHLAANRYEVVSREEGLRLLATEGERISHGSIRTYPCGAACAAVVGYVAEIDRNQLEQQAGGDYRMGDMVGIAGAEKVAERRLRGMAGEEFVEVNALGQAVRNVGNKSAQSGALLRLTIDSRLQQVVFDAFEENVGSAVVIDPRSGEILALVSVPGYDPNNISESLTLPNQPFFNRALAGVYPPGSTFKMVIATAALEEGVISESTQIADTGEIVIGDFRFGNWYYDQYGGTEGEVDVIRALARSNDVFFYHLGGKLGAERMAEWANAFGYGSDWGLKEWGAVSGLVPTPEWKQAQKGERWYLGNSYHMSIGQGDVLATPLQVAMMTAGAAMDGVVCPPHFEFDAAQTACVQLNLSSKTSQLVRQGMKEACLPGGTAPTFFDFSPQVGCKTGTAEQGIKGDVSHAWFTAYAPEQNPEVVVTVLVEKGGQGSEVAAPIAKKVLEWWFRERGENSE
jgi:penicillin-binding protein 2